MFTYQVRKRIFRLQEDQTISFPNHVSVVFYLQPLQPFGVSADGGRTAVQNIAAKVFFNANTGHHYIVSATPLKPLEVLIEEPKRIITLKGNQLHISEQFESLQDLDLFLHSIFFAFPIILNVEFGDPPLVERVEGVIGTVPFRWELQDWRMLFHITNQEEQEKKVAMSWLRMDLLSNHGNRRLMGALHYFHIFCRLCRAGQSPWEFMSEAIVNLSKVLEVLFPSIEGGGTIEAARDGLKKLGYADKEIESSFVPAIALRNHIDAGHVDLSLFSQSQLSTLHAYTEAVEEKFRDLLAKVLRVVEAGEYEVEQYTGQGHRKETAKIIDRLSKYYGNANPNVAEG